MTDTKLTQLEQRALVCPDLAKTFIVKDEPTLLKANEFIHGVKALIKEIKDFFRPMKDKAKQAHQAIVDAERKLLEPLNEAELIVKNQIAPYLATLQRLEREAREKAKQAENPFDEAVPEQEAVAPVPKAPKLKGTGIREDWKWSLIDMDKVPRRFLKLNETEINYYVKQHKEKAEIPGIKVFKIDTVVTGYDRG